MATTFQRGATPPGGRDGTPFNNSFQLADAAGRVNEARAVSPHAKFQPAPLAQKGQRTVVTPPGATRLDNHTAQQGARPIIPAQGQQIKEADRKAPGAPVPPGLRPAALRARGIGPTAPGEYGGVTIGGRPLGPQVGHTSHAAPERPLAMALGPRAPVHLPPPGRNF